MSQSRPPSASPSNLDDFALMAGVREHDAAAMTALYDQYSSLVYGVCLRALHDPGDAEDLLVDIFSELWERGDRFDPARGSPVGHIMGLTRSRAVDRLRSRKSVSRGKLATITGVEAASELRAPADGPLQAAMLSERRGAVVQALQSLPNDQRVAVELAFFEALSHAEVAERLGQPLGTIKSRIRQGLLQLRTVLCLVCCVLCLVCQSSAFSRPIVTTQRSGFLVLGSWFAQTPNPKSETPRTNPQEPRTTKNQEPRTKNQEPIPIYLPRNFVYMTEMSDNHGL